MPRRKNNFVYLIRTFAVWLLIIFAESIHGTLRQLFLAPVVGDFPARRVAFFTGMLLIFLIAYFFVRWIDTPNTKALFVVGSMWSVFTLAFEFGLGYFVLNYSRERMLEDYDVSRGGLMAFGIVFMVFAPYLAARLHGLTNLKT